MKTRTVVSREYKVMLRPGKFAGPRKQLLAAARQLWNEFAHAVEASVFQAGGSLDTIDKERLIVFLDSEAQHLRAGGYIVRVRRRLEGGRPEVTLKFRHPDRFVAEGRRMKSRHLRATAKFEEDIKAPFVSLYSFSTRGKVGKKKVPTALDEVERLFPDLARHLGDVDGRLALGPVNGFTARELVVTGPTLTIGARPGVEAECALIVWYDHDRDGTGPVAVEFSYRYGNAKGRYDATVARRAFEIFDTLQKDLTAWIDPNPRTKTAFVYG